MRVKGKDSAVAIFEPLGPESEVDKGVHADAYAGHNDTVTWCGAAGISHHGRRDQVG